MLIELTTLDGDDGDDDDEGDDDDDDDDGVRRMRFTASTWHDLRLCGE